MNVYDFDRTIYDGNSTFDFFIFCLKRHPKIIKYIFNYLPNRFLYKIGKITTEQAKENFFAFVQDVDGIDFVLDLFWHENENKIKIFYLLQQQSDDLIISASPKFLLEPVCKMYGITHLIASEVDRHTGKFIDKKKYCYGRQKVRYFLEKYENNIENFYSDSLTDEPLARIAANAFLVKKDKILAWKIEKSQD